MSVSEFSESMNFQNNYLRTIITATENSANSGIPNCLVQTMNGRIYDPTLARFLSPDPILQNLSYTQSHNRYSYCLNNPLKYTDPSGYNIHPIWIAGSNEIMNGTISIFARKGGWTPISGNHWSNNSLYRYNDNTLNSANFMLMNERTFINTYGKTEYWITYIGFTGGLTTLTSEEILEFFKSDEQKQKEREFNNKKALGRAGNIGYGLMVNQDLEGDPPGDGNPPISNIWFYSLVLTNSNFIPLSTSGRDLVIYSYRDLSLSFSNDAKISLSLSNQVGPLGADLKGSFSFYDQKYSSSWEINYPSGQWNWSDDIWTPTNPSINMSQLTYGWMDIMNYTKQFYDSYFFYLTHPQKKYGF